MSSWTTVPSLRASYPHPGTHSSSLLAKKNTGLVALPSACTATCPVHIPTPQGSHASVRRVDEDGKLVPLRLPPCYEPKLSLGGNALEDQPIISKFDTRLLMLQSKRVRWACSEASEVFKVAKSTEETSKKVGFWVYTCNVLFILKRLKKHWISSIYIC